MLLLVLLAAAGCVPGGTRDGNDTPDPTPEPPPPVPTVTVTVTNGAGSGEYEAGAQVVIRADPASAGMLFDGWTGDTAALEDPGAAQTTLTVPEGGAAVTATYRTVPATPGEVTASVETDPVPGGSDAADDACVWIHPTDPAQSTIIGTDKSGHYLLVYDLAGNEIQRVAAGRVNNVDVRYDFSLDGESVAIVAASNRTQDAISAYRVDPATREIVHIGDVAAGISVYGFCMYRSADTGDHYGFVTSKSGVVEQWRLYDGGNGGIAGELVRTFDVGATVEGCVADDELGQLYLAEESVGVWKYGAEPADGAARTKVDGVGSNGHLTGDVEGLTIYYASDGTGYLIASSQGADSFQAYEREGDNAYVMTFSIVGGAVDGVSGTDGIDVTNVAMGPAFPSGAFIAQDNSNSGGNQNFKLVPWERVALASTPGLTIDTAYDPRG